MSDTTPGHSPGVQILSRMRPFFTGLLPLFMVAHFGHHVVGAMLNPLLPMIRTDLNLNYTTVGSWSQSFPLPAGSPNCRRVGWPTALAPG